MKQTASRIRTAGWLFDAYFHAQQAAARHTPTRRQPVAQRLDNGREAVV